MANGLVMVDMLAAQESMASKEIEDVVHTVVELSNIFERSKITFSYETTIGKNGVAFYQAKAIRWASEANASDLPSTSDLMEPQKIIPRREKLLDATVLTQGPLQSIEVFDGEDRKTASKRVFRSDGTRFYVSVHENRWDILSDDVLPLATPADVLSTIPNIFPSIPISRSMLNGEMSFPQWINQAISAKSTHIVDSQTIRFAGALEDAPNNSKLREIVEIYMNAQRTNIESIKQWRVVGQNVDSWQSYTPLPHEFQEIRLADFKEISPGITVPTSISATYSARWKSVLANLSPEAREKAIKVTGLEESGQTIDVLTHVWTIKEVDLKPVFTLNDFAPPKGVDTVVYDYLTETFRE